MKESQLIGGKPAVWQALSHRQASVWGHTDVSASRETDFQMSETAQVQDMIQVERRKLLTHAAVPRVTSRKRSETPKEGAGECEVDCTPKSHLRWNWAEFKQLKENRFAFNCGGWMFNLYPTHWAVWQQITSCIYYLIYFF